MCSYGCLAKARFFPSKDLFFPCKLSNLQAPQNLGPSQMTENTHVTPIHSSIDFSDPSVIDHSAPQT